MDNTLTQKTRIKLRILVDMTETGFVTKILDLATGKEFQNVKSAHLTIEPGDVPSLTLEIYPDELEIVGIGDVVARLVRLV